MRFKEEMNFWDELPQPFFTLAPMEDVTYTVFRQVVARAARPEVFFTEFMNVDGFCHPDGRESVARRLVFSPSETPIVAQIWGKDPVKFAQTAREISQMSLSGLSRQSSKNGLDYPNKSGNDSIGFAGIDINMGCPDKAVVKSGGGAALIKSPELAVEIIRATRAAVKLGKALPISVKTRLGYSGVEEWQDWLTVLLGQRLDALTVHLRTKKEMSKVPAHYELIPEIVRLRDELSPRTKLIINGDVANRAAGLNLIEKYVGIDGIMIGRGVFADPFCFEKSPRSHDRAELVELLKYHLELFARHCEQSEAIQYKTAGLPRRTSSARNDGRMDSRLRGNDKRGSGNGSRKYAPMKKFFKVYINGFPEAKQLRAGLMETNSAEEALRLL
jgi:tRNA-dihydrouridine synthase